MSSQDPPQGETETNSEAPNVAMAYPPAQSSLMKRLPMILSAGLMFVYFMYQKLTVEMQAEETIVKSSTANESAPQIALCYTGHVGTFSNVYKQNKEIMSKLTTAPLSTFMVIDLNDDYKNSHTQEHYKRSHEIGALQPIFNELEVHSVETYSSEEETKKRAGMGCVGDHAPFQDDGGHFSHAYATLNANARCYNQIKAHEAKTGVKFDWVVRLRPDMEISVTLPTPEKTPRVHLSGLAIALVPRELCDDYFSAVQAFDDINCKTVKELDDEVCRNYSYEADSPECLMIKWLKLKNIVPSNGVHVNRRIMYPETS